MASYDFTAQRLYVDTPLSEHVTYECTSDQANYLLNVLRLDGAAEILVFNGRDGEWRACVRPSGKRRCVLEIVEQTRTQESGPDIHYLFAPLKRARLDYMVQKATELGVSVLQPILTHRTNVARIKLERMRSNVIEAAEQCGILHIPEVREPLKIENMLSHWDPRRPIIFCDENADHSSPVEALGLLEPGAIAVLVGPEGGFDSEEQNLLLNKPYVTAISLGKRIMRADTAGVAVLSLVNAVLGDWR